MEESQYRIVEGPLDREQFKRALEQHHLDRKNLNPPTLFKQLSLRGEEFPGLDATDAAFVECDFSKTQFNGAEMAGAVFRSCPLMGADFSAANLVGSSFYKSDFTEAVAIKTDFQGADFTLTKLKRSDLQEANLRGAQNVILDETMVRRADFSVAATDPWSVLRRTYTGPRFAINMLMLLGFVLVLAAKAYGLYGLSMAEAVNISKGSLSTFCAEKGACETRTILTVLSGWHEGWLAFSFVILSLIYNGLRLGLTYFVAMMREEEERSGRTPMYESAVDTDRSPVFKQKVSDLLCSYRWLYEVHLKVRYLQWVTAGMFFLNLGDILTTEIKVPKSING